MLVILKDNNLRLHGKPSRQSPYYFRWHYGAQRLVYYAHVCSDCPTPSQQRSRSAFTALRQAVAHQLHDPILRALWEDRFRKRRSSYKFLHTYVYAQLKKAQNEGRSPKQVADTMRWEQTARESLTRLLLTTALLRNPRFVGNLYNPSFQPSVSPDLPMCFPLFSNKVESS